MKIPEIWYFVCWVFGFHSLDTLVEESHEVVYGTSNGIDPVNYLACEKLAKLYQNQTEIDLKVLANDLCEHFNSSSDDGMKKKYPIRFEELILNRTKSGGYLILNGRVCLIANDEKELNEIELFLSPRLEYFAIQRSTFDLVQMKNRYDKIDQLVVLQAISYSNCDRRNSRFFCLNGCFKRRARLARYFYRADEIGLVQLNYDGRNEIIKENEKICFEKCKRENCEMVQLISNDVSIKEPENIEAQSKLSEFDFWLQFIGLVGSFAGLSLHDLISIAIEFTASKVRKRKVRIALFYLMWIILLLLLASFGYLVCQTILKYKEKESNLVEKETRYLSQPKIIQLAICVKIKEYENKTMLEIERETDEALGEELDGIYTNYQGKLFQTSYQVQPKVLFKEYSRCFLLSIYPNYQITPSSPILTIKFKKFDPNNELYLLSEKEDLNSQSFEYFGLSVFVKRMVKRLRTGGKCVDYEEKYAGNCTSRWNCMDKCIQRKYMKRFNRTCFTNYQVINRDWFSSTEWNTSKLMETNKTIYDDILKNCMEEIPNEKPCDEIDFEATIRSGGEGKKVEINLQFDVIRSTEEETTSWYKLTLDLLTIQSIFFGLTIFQLVRITFNFILKENKMVLFFIYLLCSIGAGWHTYHIFDLIISQELVPTCYYKLAKQIEMPEITFCYQINEKIDKNQKLTGAYLEELTSELTSKNVFDNTTYLNESNEWVPFDLDLVKPFFFQAILFMKCFRFKIDLVYDRDQFHFSTDKHFLGIKFRPFVNRKDIHFMIKSKENAKFGKIINLKNYYSITQETSLYEYEDRFSFIRRHFYSFKEEDDVSDLYEQLLGLQSNDHNLRTLNLPMAEKDFKLELDEDLFEQLYSVQKNRYKRTDLNYRQTFVDNYLETNYNKNLKFTFGLTFLQKVVFSTNEENLGKLILSLLNVFYIWFDLVVLDIYPFFSLFHDHLLVHLYLHLPVFLNGKVIQFLPFACKWLKKIKAPLYEILKPQTEFTATSPILD